MRQCPGSQALAFSPARGQDEDLETRPSRLTHWPVQLHLISSSEPQYRNSDLLVAADCVAYAHADFHRDFLKGRTLAIACPKLDPHQEMDPEKLAALIDQAKLRSIRVMIMQVPRCHGLLRHVVEAARRAARTAPVRCITVGIHGEIMSETPVARARAGAFVS